MLGRSLLHASRMLSQARRQAPRSPDLAEQSPALLRTGGARWPRGRQRPARRAAGAGPGSLQGGERHAGARLGRSGAEDRGGTHERRRAPPTSWRASAATSSSCCSMARTRTRRGTWRANSTRRWPNPIPASSHPSRPRSASPAFRRTAGIWKRCSRRRRRAVRGQGGRAQPLRMAAPPAGRPARRSGSRSSS